MLLEHTRPVHVFSGQFSDANLVIEFSNSNICKAGTQTSRPHGHWKNWNKRILFVSKVSYIEICNHLIYLYHDNIVSCKSVNLQVNSVTRSYNERLLLHFQVKHWAKAHNFLIRSINTDKESLRIHTTLDKLHKSYKT